MERKEKRYVFAVLEGTLNYCNVQIKFNVSYEILARRECSNCKPYYEICLEISNIDMLENIFYDIQNALKLPENKPGINSLEWLYQFLAPYYEFPKNVETDHYKVEYIPKKVIPAKEIIATILRDIMFDKI